MEYLICEKNKPRIGDLIRYKPKNGDTHLAQIIELGDTSTLLKDGKGGLSSRLFETKNIGLYSVIREYKVMELNKFTEQSNQEVYLHAELSHVVKTFLKDGDRVKCHYTFSVSNTEHYVVPINSDMAQQMIQFPHETIMIDHRSYFVERDFFNLGRKSKASFFDDLFGTPNKMVLTRRGDELFYMNDKFN